uniref:Uncharacterized protein n=1 Tax=Pyricularia oryzae (strain P131) TaxID=1143193 RepID=L7IUY2_PYRO1
MVAILNLITATVPHRAGLKRLNASTFTPTLVRCHPISRKTLVPHPAGSAVLPNQA